MKNKKQKRIKNKKKPINVMRPTHRRFPFLDTFAERSKGFGHSRGIRTGV